MGAGIVEIIDKRKIDEFSKKIPADIKGDIRKKMLQSELEKWLNVMRSSAKVRIYKENLKKVEIK